VADLIREEISDLLRKDVDDPRLQTGALISVTDVEISDDLRNAKVFISVMGSAEDKKGVFAALDHAAGFLRRELGSRLNMRYVPEIRFFSDESIERGARVDQLLHSLAGDSQRPEPAQGEPHGPARRVKGSRKPAALPN
jgi:ribosome-binding factor A